MNFPNSPVDGQIFIVGTKKYQWSSAVNTWRSKNLDNNSFDDDATLPKLLRQAATRCRIATNIGGGVPTSQSRSFHFAPLGLTNWQVEYPNWYNNGPGDTGTGMSINIECALEYPEGVFTRIKFSGQNQGTILDRGRLLSDVITVRIPKGGKFFLRPYISGATYGVPFSTMGIGPTYYDSANGERSEFGSAVPNKAMGGTISDMQSGIYLPTAIVQMSPVYASAAAFVGDSRVAGIGDSFANTTYSYLGEFERALGPFTPFINIGISGDSAQNYISANRSLSRALISQYCTQIFMNFGGDIRNGTTAANTLTYFKAARDLHPLMPMIVGNVSPVTTSTDNWATTANQTVTANEANRIAFNTLLAQGQDFAGFMNISAVMDDGNGKWKPNYTDDGSHAKQLSSRILANSGVISPAFLK